MRVKLVLVNLFSNNSTGDFESIIDPGQNELEQKGCEAKRALDKTDLTQSLNILFTATPDN